MKKIISCLFLFIFGFSVVGCNKPTSTQQEYLLSDQVGEFIKLTAMDSKYDSLVNNLGMSGAEGRIHTHNNNSDDMYASTNTEFVFDIGHNDTLGKLYIWNYNKENNTQKGIKKAQISFSNDNENFSKLMDIDFLKASGTNLEKAQENYVDFNGTVARYIKITALENFGGSEYGLSEIRLYRFRDEVKKDNYIQASPIERYDNKKQWTVENDSYNLTNGSGMSDLKSKEATHDNKSDNMYLIKNSALGFTFDLKGNYPVKSIAIWNYNAKDGVDNGLKTFKIKKSDDGVKWVSATNLTYTLSKGSGENGLSKSLIVDFDSSIQTRYIMIENVENYGGNMTGLSAVKFYLGEGWFCDNSNDWTALFSNYDGWSGADGIYSVKLNSNDISENSINDDTFFVFSDTIISKVDGSTDLRGNSQYMPNNTFAKLSGSVPDSSKISFIYPTNEKGAALIKPNPLEPTTQDPNTNKYYWLGDTFRIGNKLYVYSLKIDKVDTAITGFPFAQTGVDLASFDIVDGNVNLDSLKLINDTNAVLCKTNKVNGGINFYFGGAVFENTTDAGVINPDGYYYIYGYCDTINSGRNLVVSRVLPKDIENFSEYKFLNKDNQWVSDTTNLKYLASDIAPEISISQIQSGENKGKFLLVNTHLTIGNDIRVAMSDSLTSNFTSSTTVFYHDTTNEILGLNNNSYNAKAHPALSTNNEIIISYNVNGDDCFKYGNIYRPRFLRLANVS